MSTKKNQLVERGLESNLPEKGGIMTQKEDQLLPAKGRKQKELLQKKRQMREGATRKEFRR